MRAIGGVFVALALVLASPAVSAPKPKKPKFDIRATPRLAMSPAHIFFTAELTGGDDIEEFYCLEVEWDWDDGGKSVQETDCPPYESGAKIERRFTASHDFRLAGQYNVKVNLRRENKVVVSARVSITVRPGLGDTSQELGLH